MIVMLTALALAADSPLPPTSRWVLAPTGQCTLSRDYDSPAMPLTVGFRAYPLGKYSDFVVVVPKTAVPVGMTAAITVAIGSLEPTPPSRAFATADGRSWVVSFPIKRDQLSKLETAEMLTMTIQEPAPLTFRLTGMKKALAQLAACDAAATRALGIDPDEQASVATPAVPTRSQVGWISSDDYPLEALRDESQGFSYIVWTVGLDGRVSDCQVAVSSGDPVLDATACKAITRRARYTPAIDRNGQPVISHQAQGLNWQLPTDR